MPIVDMNGVQTHAQQRGYTIGRFPITDLTSISRTIHAAGCAVPVTTLIMSPLPMSCSAR